MGRIRTIKPEFPQSESIGKLSRDARLLFLQLFTIVDDQGRTRAASRMLASLLYPYDDDAGELIGSWLYDLETTGRIIRYEVGGSSYLQIVNWDEHQKIDRPSPSKLPPPPVEPDLFSRQSAKPRDNSTSAREASRSLALDMDQDMDLEGNGKENEKDARESARSSFARFFDRWKAKVSNEGEATARRAWASLGCAKDTEAILAGVDRYAANKPKDRIAMSAERFLRDERWRDHAPASTKSSTKPRVFVKKDSPEWEAWRKHRGRTLPTDNTGDGWWCESRWPPGHGQGPPSAGDPAGEREGERLPA